MIQMAENRGLFGRTSSSSSKPRSKGPRKKQDKPATPPQKTKRRIKDAEVARIATPTHTFLRHTQNTCDIEKCPKCRGQEEQKEKTPIYRQWWSETTRHIIALRSNLIKNKIIPQKSKQINAKTVVDAFLCSGTSGKIDEILAKSRGSDDSKVPIFPKLKLTREHKVEKVPMLLPVTTVRFP